MFTRRLCGGVRDMSTPSSLIAPGVGPLEAGDQPQRRRLAAARRAEHREELAARDLHVDAVDGDDLAVVLLELLEMDLPTHLAGPPASMVASRSSVAVAFSPRLRKRNARNASTSASSVTTSMIVASAFSAGVGALRACA